MKFLRRVNAASLILLAVTACSAGMQVHLPEITGRRLSREEGRIVLERLRARSEEVRSLRSLARAELVQNDQEGLVRYAIVLQKPAQLRLEALPLNGVYALSLFVVDSGRAVLLNPIEKTAYVENEGSGLLQRLLGVPIDERALMSFLMGRVSLELLEAAKADETIGIWHDAAGRTYTVQTSRNADLWIIDSASLLLREAYQHSPYDQEVSFAARYSESKREGDLEFPAKVLFKMPRRAMALTLEMISCFANRPVADSVFKIPIPSDYSVRTLANPF